MQRQRRANTHNRRTKPKRKLNIVSKYHGNVTGSNTHNEPTKPTNPPQHNEQTEPNKPTEPITPKEAVKAEPNVQNMHNGQSKPSEQSVPSARGAGSKGNASGKNYKRMYLDISKELVTNESKNGVSYYVEMPSGTGYEGYGFYHPKKYFYDNGHYVLSFWSNFEIIMKKYETVGNGRRVKNGPVLSAEELIKAFEKIA